MARIGQGSTGDPAAVEEITATLQAAGAGVGTDVEAVVSMFLDDPSTLLVDYLAPGVSTVEELRATAASFDDAADVVCENRAVTVHVLAADLALSIAANHAEATMPDGSKLDNDTRVTDVWRRVDGR